MKIAKMLGKREGNKLNRTGGGGEQGKKKTNE